MYPIQPTQLTPFRHRPKSPGFVSGREGIVGSRGRKRSASACGLNRCPRQRLGVLSRAEQCGSASEGDPRHGSQCDEQPIPRRPAATTGGRCYGKGENKRLEFSGDVCAGEEEREGMIEKAELA